MPGLPMSLHTVPVVGSCEEAVAVASGQKQLRAGVRIPF